ncbi:MAG: oligopeptide:H+ symporter [Bryobacteraceae bacterium]|nr:oligopeptide:H+ symporter [Bryobacteraceae bacterium]
MHRKGRQDASLSKLFSKLAREITDRIRAAAQAKLHRRAVPPQAQASQAHVGGKARPASYSRLSTEKLIAIGASTGGTEAIREVLTRLPADSPAVLITQHMPPGFTKSFAQRLDSLCRIMVSEADDGERVLPGHAYIAPGGRHMRLARSGSNYVVAIDDGEPVNRHRPSVEVLFRSVAANAGPNALGVMLFAAVAAFFVWAFAGRGWTPQEKKRLAAVMVLFTASALFWCMFEQAGSTLNLFAERSTDKNVLGFEFPASWLQSLNALFIIALAPVFAWLWLRLGDREPSSPTKFSFGLLSAGLGFAVLALGASRAAEGNLVSPLWLVVVYFMHTVGELCLSPVGLSAMTKLAPARISSLLMGVWFLSLSAGNYLGGRIASMYEALPLPTLFALIAAFGIGAAGVLALLVGPTKRLMGDVK